MTDIIKFTKHRKARWIKWLRDNPDKQGIGALFKYGKSKQQIKYCCLGVYCMLNGVKINQDISSFKEIFLSYDNYGHGTYDHLNEDVMNGTLPDSHEINSSEDPTIPFSELTEQEQKKLNKYYASDDGGYLAENEAPDNIPLSVLNDNKFTFNRIADLISKFIKVDE